MELTLKRLLEQAEFNQVRRGGYDRDEVNALLDRAVAMAAKVEAKLTETLEDARRGTGPSEAEIEAEVERRVEAALARSRSERTGPSEEEQAEEVARALLLAQRSADEAIRDARDEAEAIRSKAESEAAATRAEAAAELETERARARERIRSEISELEGIRERLRTDVGLLERHVEDQRNQLRSTIAELQRLLDDPAGFALAPAPVVEDPKIPGDDAPALIEGAAPIPERHGDPEPADRADSEESPTRPAQPEPDPGAGPALDFGGVEHEPPEPSEPTEPVAAVTDNDDLFMAELRKAIEDDEPLGPRDPEPVEDSGAVRDPFENERRGWRFGRR